MDRRKVFYFLNKVFSVVAERVVAAVRAQAINLIVWGVIALLIVAVVVANRSTKDAINGKLTSSDPAVRQAEVLSLASSRDLADALTDTEDPNSPATSPANVRSNAIREQAATELNTLISTGRLTAGVSMDNLFLLSKDSDSAVKTIATTGLSIVAGQSDENLRVLVSRLSDGDPDVRTAAANALGQIGGSRAAQLTAPLLSNAAAAADSQTALGKIGKPAIVYLGPMLAGATPELRGNIVTTLGTIGDLSGVPTILSQVDAQPPSPSVHRLAIIALANVILKSVPERADSAVTGVPAAAPPPALTPPQQQLANSTIPIFSSTLMNTGEDSFARARSALALGRLGGPVAITTLVASLGDFDSRVARAALTGIQQVGQVAVPALDAAANSPNLVVRVAAAWALGGIGDSTALAAMHHSLTDSSPEVRQAGAAALGDSANPAAGLLLVPMLSDTNGLVASAASNSLHLLGAPAIPLLVGALNSPNQAAAFYASSALRQIGNDAEPAIAAVLTSAPESEEVWAAVTLGQIHDPRARAALATLSASGSARARWAANQALQQLGEA